MKILTKKEKNVWLNRNFRKERYFQKYYFYEDVKYM